MSKRKSQKGKTILELIMAIIIAVTGINYFNTYMKEGIDSETQTTSTVSYELSEIPEYKEEPYVTLNNNIPNFKEEEYTTKSFEKYSELDVLGRCGVAYANVCKEIMPPERRYQRKYKQCISFRMGSGEI